MGLRTTLSASKPITSVKEARNVAATGESIIVPGVEVVPLSDPNVSAHGHGNMAPALTEPLSQTNKLSSSATSASPRPSSNNFISESESVSRTIDSLSVSHENILINSNALSQNETSSSFIITNNKNHQDKGLANKNGSFQSAFEHFQEIRRLQRNSQQTEFPTKTSPKSKKSPTERQHRSTVASPVNGRLSNGQMGPMCDTNINFQEVSTIEHKDDSEIGVFKGQQSIGGERVEDVEETHMDFSSCDEIINSANQDDISNLQTSNNNNNNGERQDKASENDTVQDSRQQIVAGDGRGDEQQTVGISQDTTSGPVNREECDTPNQSLQDLEEIKHKSPPRTPPSDPTSDHHHQTQTTPVSSLTPQTGTPSSMGLQKDFIKDTAEMEQVLGELGTSDMDLLQVLKGFDTTPGGEGAFCELSLFTDVDVMTSYEEVNVQQPKDVETREVRDEIEKRQLQMQRKCDFLLRRLRKIQGRYMGKHASEEIAGLFEWQANPTLRRDKADSSRSFSYEDDKRHQISTAALKAFVRRISNAAEQQHSSLMTKRNKVGRPSNASLQADASGSQNKVTTPVATVVPPITDKMVNEIAHVSGHLHTEIKEIQAALDSDVTASSSGGESADEMQQFNNAVQQPLSIAKRAAWRWARDRAAIASRWTWLLAQISDLEYRIRQHTELHHQIRKNKGAVAFEKCSSEVSSSSSPVLPSSVNGYRGILPGNSKALDNDSPTSSNAGIAPNGAYDAAANNSTGSCRTRAFQRACFRKRKLLQTANVHTVSKKAARPSTVKCGCQWPLQPCGLCTGRSDPTAPRDLPDTMTPSERVALLDSGFHPVLSFPEDVSHSIHFEATMRLPEWQNRVLRCASKASTSSASMKGAVAVQKAAEREDRSKKYVDNSRRKYNRKYPQDLIAANKLKNAKARRSLHGDQYNNNHNVKSKHRKLISSTSMGGGTSGCGSSTGGGGAIGGGGMSSAASTAGSDSIGLIDSLDTSNGQLPRSKNASPTPGGHSSSNHKSERMDRRNRNSYDIDNIVIPYSVAAATRVEILQYKEIPTPKWRIIDETSELGDSQMKSIETLTPSENSETDKTDNFTADSHVGGGDGINDSSSNSDTKADVDVTDRLEAEQHHDEDETEDITDDAILIRHERALLEERKKFQTYLKYPWSTRSRANRRTDSRAESSGANTPDPSSPAPNTPSAGGDQESVPSPTAPSTPQAPLETLDENTVLNHCSTSTPNNNQPPPFNSAISAAKRVERRRTASGRKEREHSKDDASGNLTPDAKELVQPYEPLEFPLSDDIFEAMLELMPNDHQLLEECLVSDSCDDPSDKTTRKDSITSVSGGDNKTLTEQQFIASLNNASIIDTSGKIVSFTSEIIEYGPSDSLIGEDSDTDSADSGAPDEDPNDPEWRELE